MSVTVSSRHALVALDTTSAWRYHVCMKGAADRTAHTSVSPGEHLDADFLQARGISRYQLAKAIGADTRRISLIVDGDRKITVETGLRMSRALGVDDMYWIECQARYDAEKLREELGAELDAIERIEGRNE